MTALVLLRLAVRTLPAWWRVCRHGGRRHSVTVMTRRAWRAMVLVERLAPELLIGMPAVAVTGATMQWAQLLHTWNEARS